MPQVSTKTQSVLPTQPKVRILGINEPIRVGETLKQQEGQLGQTLSPVSEQKYHYKEQVHQITLYHLLKVRPIGFIQML